MKRPQNNVIIILWSSLNFSDDNTFRILNSVLSNVHTQHILAFTNKACPLLKDELVHTRLHKLVALSHLGNNEVQEYDVCNQHDQKPNHPEDGHFQLPEISGVYNPKVKVPHRESDDLKDVTKHRRPFRLNNDLISIVYLTELFQHMLI